MDYLTILRSAVWQDTIALLGNPWAYVPTILVNIISFIVSLCRGGHTAMKEAWKSVGISLLIKIGAWILIYGAFALYITKKRIYEEKEKIEDTVPQLEAEIEYRKNNLDVEGPAFGNVMDTINVFRSYRAAIGPGAECEIRITSPDISNISRQIQSIANVGSNCRAFGPVDTSGDPEWKKATFEGMVSGKIKLNAAKEAPGAEQLFLNLRNYVPVEREFKTFPGRPAYVIWLQFGPGVKWNTE